MNALIIHDTPFYNYDGVFYSGASFISSTWSRYLAAFDDLTVVGRGRYISDTSNLSISSTERVNFAPFYDVSGGLDYLKKKNKIKNHIEPLIINTDAVIVRLPSAFGAYAIEICRKHNKQGEITNVF